MGLNFAYEEGQTPLDEEEQDGLRIRTITTRAELDEWEQKNIEDALQWTWRRRFRQDQILSEPFVRGLHRRMYGQVWKWAGSFRTTNKNIGVDKWQIPTELRQLLDDTGYWIENHVYGSDEVAIRFKHRLVSIHCFANGNGRHSRLMADLIAEKLFGRPVFSWGAGSYSEAKEARSAYLQAIRQADRGEWEPLIRFARS